MANGNRFDNQINERQQRNRSYKSPCRVLYDEHFYFATKSKSVLVQIQIHLSLELLFSSIPHHTTVCRPNKKLGRTRFANQLRTSTSDRTFFIILRYVVCFSFRIIVIQRVGCGHRAVHFYSYLELVGRLLAFSMIHDVVFYLHLRKKSRLKSIQLDGHKIIFFLNVLLFR